MTFVERNQQVNTFAAKAPAQSLAHRVRRGQQRSTTLGALALGLPRFLRQTFHEWRFIPSPAPGGPDNITNSSGPRGNGANTAIRALAFKWIRILFHCWKERKPYDEAIYQRALDARPPKKPLAAPAVELQWKNVAGFRKIAIKGA